MFNLYALVIKLTAANTAILHGTQGNLAHAAFFDIIRIVDPKLSDSLHSLDSRKPFTISQLYGFGRANNNQLHIKAGQEGYIRVTILDSVLFQTFLTYFLDNKNRPMIRLNAAEFSISEILSTPNSHTLAGYSSLTQLWEQWEAADLHEKQHRSLTLRFASPTAFTLRNRGYRAVHVLPDPATIFGQLAWTWDAVTGTDPVTSSEPLRAFAEQFIVITRHDIRTEVYRYHTKQNINPHIGFIGQATYKMMGNFNPKMTRHIHRLADLAFFTGCGTKTTQGMGQVRRL